MFISFGISYIAGSLPTIKEYLQKNKSLHDRIDFCYAKALNNWTVNEDIRQIEIVRGCRHFDELQAYIAGDSSKIDSYIKDLLLKWADELRKDPVCYDFIIEQKIDVVVNKLELGFSEVINELTGQFEKTNTKIDAVQEGVQKTIEMLQAMSQNRKVDDGAKIAEMLEGVIDTSINTLIENLHLKTAIKQIEQIESLFSDVLNSNSSLRAKLMLNKGVSLSFYDAKKAFEYYHLAFLLDSNNNKCIEAEVKKLILEKQDDQARLLVGKVQNDKVLETFLKVVSSDNQIECYKQLDELLKKDYNLRLMLLSRWGESEETYAILFSDEQVDIPNTLSYQNLNQWIFVLTNYNLRTSGFLPLSDRAQVSQETIDAFNVGRYFNSFLIRTEIIEEFADFRALYYYWGYMVERKPSLIDDYQKIDKSSWLGIKKNTYALKEASMLAMAHRFEESFTVIASLKENFDPNTITFLILLSYHSGNISYYEWLMKLQEEKGFKLDDYSARYIALCIERIDPLQVQKNLKEDAFENKNNAKVLNELCHYYNGGSVDIDIVKSSLDGLNDDMTAYAAMLLSENGEPELAYKILSPKIEESKVDFKQRVFIEIMQRLPQEQPKLYRILQNLRKSGGGLDDGILICEFGLDMRLADYENAHDVAEILYQRNQNDESRFVNLILTKGKVCPQKINNYLRQILSRSYSSFIAVKILSTTLTENGYLDEAVEVLYQYVLKSENWGDRTYFYQETSIGPLAQVSQKAYSLVEDGHYVVCDLGNNERQIYQAKEGNRIGSQLIGMKEGEIKKFDIAGEEKELTILHILNKYGKLSYDIMKESMSGDNAFLVPGKMDINNPVGSVESLIRKIDPDAELHQKELNNRNECYSQGTIGLCNMVDEGDLLGGYYQLLFTQQKIYVGPWQFLLQLCDMSNGKGTEEYVLDITSLFILFEFENKTGYNYDQKFVISKSLYEYIVWCHKNVSRICSFGYHEALYSGNIVRFNKYSDKDLEIRCQKLLEWIKARCVIVVAENSLVLDVKIEKGLAVKLLTDSLSLLTDENRVLISDDHFVDNNFRGTGKIITTEVFSNKYFPDEIAYSYWKFLMSCNFIGLYITKSFILDQYMKMEAGQDNMMTFVMLSAEKNFTIYSEIVNGALNIMGKAKDINLATITITNLFTMMIKSFSISTKSKMVELLMQLLNYPILNYQRVKQCLADAARINNVIML